MRQTIFDFVQKELAPKANEIDRIDDFKEFRDFWKKLGGLGALGMYNISEFLFFKVVYKLFICNLSNMLSLLKHQLVLPIVQ